MRSVYIHIPFCKHICTYCDFDKIYHDKEMINKYLNSLEKEINLKYKNDLINTLYIGGGTPSSLDIDDLDKLFKIIRKFNFNYNEFTFECNIEDINDELLIFLKKHNVNRISIGVETFNEKYLNFLGRTTNKNDIIKGVLLAKKYFDNINIDLMYALPNQTLEELEEDINQFKKLDVPHISTYSLIIEPHTVIYNKKIKNIDESLDRDMYDLIIKNLCEYEHYEVSNFAKKGYASKHNLVYWDNLEYYGFGLGAGGYIDNIRYLNTRNILEYINGNYVLESNHLTKNEELENAFILGFRKISGINKKDFYNRYHKEINNEVVKKLISQNKIIDDGENIKIREDLIYVSNNILIEFIGGNYE